MDECPWASCDTRKSLQDLLADPVIRALMRVDGVTERQIIAAFERALHFRQQASNSQCWFGEKERQRCERVNCRFRFLDPE